MVVREREGSHTSESRDTDGYPADTDGYPADTDGYSAHSGNPTEDESDRTDAEQPDEPAGWWESYGYESLQDYLDEQDRVYEAVMGRQPKRRSVDELPAATLGKPEVPPGRNALRRRSRQLGLKLTEDEFAQLSAAAATYGVRPTTLARMLVHKGVRAIAELDG